MFFIGYPDTSNFLKKYSAARRIFNSSRCLDIPMKPALSLVFDILHQTRKTVFDLISRHQEESSKYDGQRSFFGEIQRVWKCGWILPWVFDISSQSKVKLRRKRRNNLCLLRSDIQTSPRLWFPWWTINEQKNIYSLGNCHYLSPAGKYNPAMN